MRNHTKDTIKLNFKGFADLDHKNPIFILVNDKMVLSKEAKKIDSSFSGLVQSMLEKKENFSGNLKEQYILTTKIGSNIHHVILIGTGNDKDIKPFELEGIGALISNISNSLKAETISILVEDHFPEISNYEIASLIGSGADLASYRFNKYQTEINQEDKPKLSIIDIYSEETEKAKKKYEFYKAINKGIFLTKDCVNEPANELYPESYVNLILNEMKAYKDISIEVFGESEMKKLGMGSLLGVGQGSHKESKFVIIRYNGIKDNSKYISLVGKGVTFDTGGISIKPASNMDQMKYDMTGSACVIGTIVALAERSAKVNVVGALPIVENMPGGNAQRPGDIVKSMSGKTIEVLNTDAEGRLILADALTYVQKYLDPKLIIDLATLTGAITVALGNVYAGCFSNNDKLADKLLESGNKVNEKLWRMPLGKEYHEMIKSEYADVANISSGHGAGSSTAAAFLEKFIDEKMIWCHLDIASVAWNKKGQKGAICSGASGFGVRLLNQFIHDNYEEK